MSMLKILLCFISCIATVQSNVRTKRFIPNADLYRVLALVEALQREQQQQQVQAGSLAREIRSDIASSSDLDNTNAVYDTLPWFPDYGDRDVNKRVFDSLGGYEVHGFKKRGGEDAVIEETPRKRVLDRLGGFQVHGWKRALDKLGGFQVHGWKKRALDSLGGFHVHGWKKRGLDSLGRSQVYKMQKSSDRSYADSNMVSDIGRGQFKHQANSLSYVRRNKRSVDQSPKSSQWLKYQQDKRRLDRLGGALVHSWKRNGGVYGTGPSNNVYPMRGPAKSGDGVPAKRTLDSLGGFQVHGWKRSDDGRKRVLDSLGNFQERGWKKRTSLGEQGTLQSSDLKEKSDLDTSIEGINDPGWMKPDPVQYNQKRSLDSLGGFQVHGWKRGDKDRSLEERDKMALYPSREFRPWPMQMNRGYDYNANNKRALDRLGGFQVHGWKRSDVDHKVGDDKRALDRLGGFQVHGWKRGDVGGNVIDDKRALDRLGGFQVHGWKRGEYNVKDVGDKKALDRLGGFQVHGWKRGDVVDNVIGDKRALDRLGGFQVHGWKRGGVIDNVIDDKRALDRLGGFQVHGWKRNYMDDKIDDKRLLDRLGSFQMHDWKRNDKNSPEDTRNNEERTTLDAVTLPVSVSEGDDAIHTDNVVESPKDIV